MELIALNIPPGVVNHGTDSTSEGRWHDVNLVRWTNGVMHPIGGWERSGSVEFNGDGVCRGAHSWFNNNGIPCLATGSYNSLMASFGGETLYNITPTAGITQGYVNSDENLSYGGKKYSRGAYGVARTSDGQTIGATTWSLDNWGEELVACSSADKNILVWQPSAASGNLVLNGDFSDATYHQVVGGDDYITLDDWTIEQSTYGDIYSKEGWYVTFDSGLPLAHPYKLLHKGDSGVVRSAYQDVSVSADTSYLVRFKGYGYRSTPTLVSIPGLPEFYIPNYSTENVRLKVTGDVSGSLVSEDITLPGAPSTPSASLTTDIDDPDDYGEFYFYFTTGASDSQVTLEFESYTSSTSYSTIIGIDDASIVAASPATEITPASGSTVPDENIAICVTSERFLFALGAGGNPRKVQWCDREDYTTWAPLPTNEAGDIELQTNGKIVCAHNVRGRTLILTSIDAHIATYQGPPTVYGFQKIATACGAVAPLVSATVSGMVFWMGQSNFYMYDGSGVQQIPCDVYDHVFSNINWAEINSAFCVANQKYHEVWWFYPSSESLENTRYVCYDFAENHWSIGVLSRSAGVDSEVFGYPYYLDADGRVYLHEKGFGHGGTKPYAETGPMRLNQGNRVIKANSLIPEEGTQGEADVYFKTRLFPNGDETTHGPYTTANPTDVRFTGREVRLKVDCDDAKDWRIGTMALRVREGGYR